jgi:hypothetical protein
VRGYIGLARPTSACIHFVRNSEISYSLREIADELRATEITYAYVDYEAARMLRSHIVDYIGLALKLEHAPYSGRTYAARAPWVPFLDDLIGLSEQTKGVVIIVDNGDSLFANARNDAFDLIEAFLIQNDSWLEKKQPCHLCFQMEKNNLVRQAFQQA